ncbi:RHS repeat-associated core domain-containing protein [Ramlibacter tataouinensis]|uniref:Rhs protein-like protein n=1 Tax=Ramlibacter tataouinensis (strain ATCC BAA-407 / DSM 14655 / LMG 21543 / TTB310) TaxID=365046 RepID=F5Y2J1_RAMTT|nr:RHS repeat-associated core domain-containing protein [Ramlibacter tataouinensis]AEG92354.1 Rhs protein-like protein [Ramlibacter tataouinensis TTB310]
MGSAAGVLRTLQRDAAGRITGYGHTNGAAAVTSLDQSFGYDSLNRLTAATQASGSTAYSYDATGNRTSKTVAGSSYANTISASSNRLTQVQDVLGAASVVHDAAGNVTSDGSASFAYSDRGRMSSATTAGGTVSYLYNGYGQRAQKSGPTALVASGASYFVYDEAGQLLGEYDANGSPVYETVYLGSTPVGAMKQTGSAANGDIATTVYNVYADHIDTPRLITKQDHTIVWRWDTAEAFGATAANQDPNNLGVFVYNQRFPGQVFDSETGLLQNWNREYNARWGRYIQSDPIGLEGGINTFNYVGANPLSDVDPTGLKSQSATSASTSDASNATGSTDVCVAGRSPAECREICSKLALPTRDFGVAFQRCVNQCMGTNTYREWRKYF